MDRPAERDLSGVHDIPQLLSSYTVDSQPPQCGRWWRSGASSTTVSLSRTSFVTWDVSPKLGGKPGTEEVPCVILAQPLDLHHIWWIVSVSVHCYLRKTFICRDHCWQRTADMLSLERGRLWPRGWWWAVTFRVPLLDNKKYFKHHYVRLLLLVATYVVYCKGCAFRCLTSVLMEVNNSDGKATSISL